MLPAKHAWPPLYVSARSIRTEPLVEKRMVSVVFTDNEILIAVVTLPLVYVVHFCVVREVVP